MQGKDVTTRLLFFGPAGNFASGWGRVGVNCALGSCFLAPSPCSPQQPIMMNILAKSILRSGDRGLGTALSLAQHGSLYRGRGGGRLHRCRRRQSMAPTERLLGDGIPF